MELDAMRDRRSGARRGGARWVRRALAGALLLAGHAHAQTVIFEEDFQNRPGPTPVIQLNTYVGVNGTTYSAAPFWLANCNGWVAQWNQPAGAGPPTADCGAQIFWNGVQQEAQGLGLLAGQTALQARENYAIAAFTRVDGNPAVAAGQIQIETSQLPLAGANGRFITFCVDAAAANCDLASPIFHFYLVSAAGVETSLGRSNVCADSTTNVTAEALGAAPALTMRVGHFNPDTALLYNGGPTFAIRMRNEQGETLGNDGAIDNLRVLDVTPRLVKAFQTPILAGQPSALTLTVTNTPDNLQKQGWQFTDNLTSGLVIATPNGLTSTCTGTTVSAPAGGTSIAVSNGNLPNGAASCVISVNVVAAAVGSYTNNASNITGIVSIDPPTATTTLEVVQNHITLSKRSLGGVGAFFLSGNNGVTGETLTTTAIGTAVVGTRRAMTGTSATTDTTILESAAAGWRVRTATCTGLAVGVTPVVNTPANSVTIPLAGLAPTSGGREVACTLTNSVDTDLSITKQNASPTGGTVNAGTTTRYTVTATNQGPLAITGATVQDTPGAGITCPPANPVTCTGAACPGGGLTVSNLTTAPGVTLGLLGVGQSAAFAFDCNVNIP